MCGKVSGSGVVHLSVVHLSMGGAFLRPSIAAAMFLVRSAVVGSRPPAWMRPPQGGAPPRELPLQRCYASKTGNCSAPLQASFPSDPTPFKSIVTARVAVPASQQIMVVGTTTKDHCESRWQE